MDFYSNKLKIVKLNNIAFIQAEKAQKDQGRSSSTQHVEA